MILTLLIGGYLLNAPGQQAGRDPTDPRNRPQPPNSSDEIYRLSLVKRFKAKQYQWVYNGAKAAVARLTDEPLPTKEQDAIALMTGRTTRGGIGHLYGLAALHLGRTEEAISAFEWAKSYGDSPDYLCYFHGLHELKLGNLDKAREWLLKPTLRNYEEKRQDANPDVGANYPGLEKPDELEARLDLYASEIADDDHDERLKQEFIEKAYKSAPKIEFVVDAMAGVYFERGDDVMGLKLKQKAYDVAVGDYKLAVHEDLRRVQILVGEERAERAAKLKAGGKPKVNDS